MNKANLGLTVHTQVTKALNSNKSTDNLIKEIHPDIKVRYNSVNVIVGKQCLGKTVVALEEIIKISLLNTESKSSVFHLLVYVTKNGDENDQSFQSLKHLIKIPHVTISEKDSVEFINTLIAAKNLYYLIRREHIEDKIIDEQRDDLFTTLHIKDFSKPFLHTLVLFDDISNSKLFSSEESFFSQQLRRCRHTNITYFLLIQGWKGLKPHIKNEITTLFVFPCFNKQQLRYIYSQSASNLNFDDFYEMYRQMAQYKKNNPDKHPYLYVNCTDGGDTYIEI